MKTNIISLILLAGLSQFTINSIWAQCIQRDEQVEAQVEAIFSKMTLKDKVGQMCELTYENVALRPWDQPSLGKTALPLASGRLSAAKMNRIFGEYRVGSILNVPDDVAQKPEVWAEVIRALDNASESLCGVPQLHGVDMIHGASYVWGATLFPQEIGQAASFNRQLPKRIGQITAYESRACLVPWVYSPVMDLGRSPLWPRLWESFGEDVFLNQQMAVELTKGLQGDDPNHIGMYNVAACLKHYMAYGAALSGKDRTPSSVSDREMMEKYFEPFKACCKAGALSIMVNSSNNNGMPFHTNRKLLTEWLKEGLDWDGMIVTDWADIDNLWKRDHVATDKKEAIAMAINAGIDMTMDPYSSDFCTLLEELVNEGTVSQERVDDAVRRILRLKVRVGLFDHVTWDIPYSTKNKKRPSLQKLYPDFASEKFTQDAIRMTEECMVLLKNQDNVLPIAPNKKILVCGPNADNFRPMNGGWTYTWQGNLTDSICRAIGSYHSFYEAIAQKFGQENVEFSEMVRYSDGGNWREDEWVPELMIEDGNSTNDKIQRADVIIACIGENSYTETVGNIDDLTLSQNQLDMVKGLAKSGKPIVLVLNEGRPRLITDIEPMAQAIVQTFLPGNYGGDALANLLSGEANFSGRLPYTYPKFSGALSTYDSKPCENVATMGGLYNYDARTDVLYPFGAGLSYCQVTYANLRIKQMAESVKPGIIPANLKGTEKDKIIFSIDLSNHSEREVSEPVLMFVSDLVATLTPDVKRLRAFKKVKLAPHETKTIELTLRVSDLAFVNEDLEWVLEPGEFRVMIANQSILFSK